MEKNGSPKQWARTVLGREKDIEEISGQMADLMIKEHAHKLVEDKGTLNRYLKKTLGNYVAVRKMIKEIDDEKSPLKKIPNPQVILKELARKDEFRQVLRSKILSEISDD